MKESKNIQESIQDWAQKSIKTYKNVLVKTNSKHDFIASQSPLNKIKESPEIIILGKNPGHDADFVENEEFLDRFFKGNDTWDGRNNKRKIDGRWQYWQNIKFYLLPTFTKELLEDDTKRILTNATFFCSSSPKNLPPGAYKETIECTLNLIDVLQPSKNVVICMGASDYFSLFKDKFGFTEYSEEYSSEGLFYGVRNGVKYIGMPHPSGRHTKWENLLIKKFVELSYKLNSFEEVKIVLEPYLKSFSLFEKGKEEIYNSVMKRISELFSDKKETKPNSKPNSSVKFIFEDFELFVILNDYDKRLIGLRYGPFWGENYVSPLTENHIELIKFISYKGYKSNKWWTAYKHFEDYLGDSTSEIADNIIKDLKDMIELL